MLFLPLLFPLGLRPWCFNVTHGHGMEKPEPWFAVPVGAPGQLSPPASYCGKGWWCPSALAGFLRREGKEHQQLTDQLKGYFSVILAFHRQVPFQSPPLHAG